MVGAVSMVQPEPSGGGMSGEAEPTRPAPIKRFPPVDTLIRNDHDFGSPSSDAQLLAGLGSAAAVNSFLTNNGCVAPAAKRLRLTSATNGSRGPILFLNQARTLPTPPNPSPAYAASHHSYLASPQATIRRTYAAQQANGGGAWTTPAVDGEGLTTSTSTFTYATTAATSSAPTPSPLPPTRKLHRLPQGQYFQYRPPTKRPQTNGGKKNSGGQRRVGGGVTVSVPPMPPVEKLELPPMGPPSASTTPSPSPTPKPDLLPAFVPAPAPPPDDTPLRQSRLQSRLLALKERMGRVLAGHSQYSAAEQLARLSAETSAYLTALTNPPPPEPSTSSGAGTTTGRKAGKNALRDAAMERKLAQLVEGGELRKLPLSKDDLVAKSPAELARWLKRYDLKRIHELLPAATAHAFTTGKGQIGLRPEESASLAKSATALSRHIADLEALYDSDATEDSSGGESCDEWDAELREPHEPLTKKKRILLAAQAHARRSHPLRGRAKWRWASERARLGSRWAWLESSLGDLEYRIRQSLDIQRQIRSRKVGVKLEGTEEDGSARTRGLAQPLPRRKYLAIPGIFQWKGKMGEQSRIACGCAPPLPPCILCSGRLQPVDKHVDPLAPLAERRGSVDASFHPALSRREVGSLPLLLQSHLKSADSHIRSQRKKRVPPPKKEALAVKVVPPMPSVPPGNAATTYPKNGLTLSLDHPTASPQLSIPNLANCSKKLAAVKPSPHSPLKLKIKLNGLSTSSSAAPSPASSSSSLTPVPGPNASRSTQSHHAKPHGKARPTHRRKKDSENASREVSPALSFDDWTSSGPSSPLVAVGGGGRRSTAYDIDNIVIDPSVAAATRVQKLEYKEIAIPGWRTVELSEEGSSRETKAEPCPSTHAPVEEYEDTSSEAYISRHFTREETEKRRFAAYKAAVWVGSQTLEQRLTTTETSDTGVLLRPPSPFPPRPFTNPLRPPP